MQEGKVIAESARCHVDSLAEGLEMSVGRPKTCIVCAVSLNVLQDCSVSVSVPSCCTECRCHSVSARIVSIR